jgi:lysozyme
MELYGVDISEFQGVINWDALNAVANFVYIRMGFGTSRKDFQFDRNKAEARRVQAAAGPLGIGYYYYAYPTLLGAVESANWFADNVGDLQPGEQLALDLEGDIGNDPAGWTLAFLQQVEARTGIKALTYLNQSEINGYNWGAVIAGNFGLWEAQYSGDKTVKPAPGQWPFAAGRQWSSTDTVAGIGNKVDGDTWYGDFDSFYAYGLKPAAPAPEPTTTTTTTEVPVTTTTTTTAPVQTATTTTTTSTRLDSLSGGPQSTTTTMTHAPAPAPVQAPRWQWLINLILNRLRGVK